jgi:hypothetical protein
MVALSDWAEKAALDWLLLGATPTRPSAIYLGIHTADPGETGATSEVNASGWTARQAITFGATTSGTGIALNTSTIDVTASGAIGPVTHISLWDSATIGAGNCIAKGAVTTARTYANTEHITVAASAISVALG